MNNEDAQKLITELESDRIERTISTTEEKLAPAICALANNFLNSLKLGYILIGVDDSGNIAGKHFGDKEMSSIGGIRSNGNILPVPSFNVKLFKFEKGDVIIIEVFSSELPPVRYKGNCYIRVGARQAIATQTEENALIDKRVAKSFELLPIKEATIDDLSLVSFKNNYLTLAISREILERNGRTDREQLASLRFFDIKKDAPTNAGILVFGLNLRYYLEGAYVQYVKFKGKTLDTQVEFEKEFSASLIDNLPTLSDFLKNNIIKEKPVFKDELQETVVRNYPFLAIRELLMNAVVHRDYSSNAPIKIYDFSDRLEIHNPGGLYGVVTAQNFPNASDYRNPVLAEALKTLGYINKFNYGINNAQVELGKNSNPQAEFDYSSNTNFLVKIPISSNWL